MWNEMKIGLGVVTSMFLLGWSAMSVAQTNDRHVGYYYPAPAQIEVYKARANPLPEVTPARRIEFVTAITLEKTRKPYAPDAVFFAKGEHAQKLIIVSLRSDSLNTIYRVRAYLAALTAVARTTPIFRNAHVEDILNFFDLVRMLGFEQITISDGDRFTHQIKFE